jgi:hypothetical protein
MVEVPDLSVPQRKRLTHEYLWGIGSQCVRGTLHSNENGGAGWVSYSRWAKASRWALQPPHSVATSPNKAAVKRRVISTWRWGNVSVP